MIERQENGIEYLVTFFVYEGSFSLFFFFFLKSILTLTKSLFYTDGYFWMKKDMFPMTPLDRSPCYVCTYIVVTYDMYLRAIQACMYVLYGYMYMYVVTLYVANASYHNA